MIHNKRELIVDVVRDAGGGGSDQFEPGVVHARMVSPGASDGALVCPQVVDS
jgi:hypothetical protein